MWHIFALLEGHDEINVIKWMIYFAFIHFVTYSWLFLLQDSALQSGEVQVEEALLEGHLGITKELLSFQSPEKKYCMGSEKGGGNLIKVRA